MGDAYATTISEAVHEGYKKSLFSTAFDTPDAEQIRSLERNVWAWSHAKSYQQLAALNQAMYSNGKILPFDEFKSIAQRINSEFSERHLETEYNTAIASAQMSSRWVQFIADKDQFPMLTYQTVGDELVRESHVLLDGITRMIDDAFWKFYYPPNGWNCRCDVIQAVSRKETPANKITTPGDIPAMFKTNLAETGLLFPKDHPYYTNLPKQVTESAHNKNPFAYKKLYQGKGSGYVYQSIMSNAVQAEIDIAKTLADLGDRVIIMPEIKPQTEAQKTLRKLVMPKGIKEGKNPDFLINGKLVELKRITSTNANTIGKRIQEGSGQADVICLKFYEKQSLKDLRREIKGKTKQVKTLQEVWMLDANNKLKKYTRRNILRWK